MPQRSDVVVVGAGVAGAATACFLAKAGLGVRLLEAEQPGFGASGRNPGFLFLLWILYGDKARKLDIFAALLAIAGAFLLSTGGKIEWQPGDLLEILGALFWGFHLVLIAKHAASFDSLSFACGQFMVCGLLNFALGKSLFDRFQHSAKIVNLLNIVNRFRFELVC